MKRLSYLLCSAGLCIVAAPAFANPAEDEAAVKKVLEESTAAWTSCNVDASQKYYAEGHGGYYPDSMELQVSSEEMHQKEVEFCEAGGKNSISYDVNGVMMFDEVALVHGSGHYTRTEPGGAVSIDSDYTFTDVLVKTDDGWKFKHSHVGAVIPMDMEAAAAAPEAEEEIVGEKDEE